MRLPIYTPSFALETSFEEILEVAKRSDQVTVALVALESRQLLGRMPEHPQRNTRRDQLERVAEFVRKHVHRGDVVLEIDPSWVVIIAVTDAAGASAIIQRLQRVLQEEAKTVLGIEGSLLVQCRAACYPADGTDAQSLLTKATGSSAASPRTTEEAPPIKVGGTV